MNRSMKDLSIVDNGRAVTSSGKEPNSNRILRGVRADLIFPAGKVHRSLKESCDNGRAGAPAAIYCAAVLEYLTAELMQIAGSICKEQKEEVITAQHLKMTIEEDEELYEFISKLATEQDQSSEEDVYRFLLSKSTSGQSEQRMDVDLSEDE